MNDKEIEFKKKLKDLMKEYDAMIVTCLDGWTYFLLKDGDTKIAIDEEF